MVTKPERKKKQKCLNNKGGKYDSNKRGSSGSSQYKTVDKA